VFEATRFSAASTTTKPGLDGSACTSLPKVPERVEKRAGATDKAGLAGPGLPPAPICWTGMNRANSIGSLLKFLLSSGSFTARDAARPRRLSSFPAYACG
jgi:hypothetical protein